MGWKIKLAQRGYGWYLALKITHAVGFPLVIAWTVVASVFLSAFILVAHVAIGFKEVATGIYATFAGIFRRRWFTGFSRRHYLSLSQYRSHKDAA